MDPGAEPEVPGLGPPEVEAVRIGELRGVAVRGAEEAEDEGPRRQRHAADLGVLQGHPSRPLDRPVVTEQFLDGGCEKRRVVVESAALVRVTEEREESVPDEVHGRLVTGDVEQDARREELRLRQPVPGLLGLDETAQKVLAGAAPSLPARSRK